MVMFLGALSLMALLLGGLLIVNTICGLLAQQKRRIGVMKAIGARTGATAGMYLGLVFVMGLLGVVLAVSLVAFGARAFAGYMAKILNFQIDSLELPMHALALQLAAGWACRFWWRSIR